MKYEWDEKKREHNRMTRNIDFTIASGFIWDEALTIEDTRSDYNESRFLSYAPIMDRLYAMIWTQRGGIRRIISLRKANKREVLQYERET
ncbi:MAG: BrnT family toxin [Ghiorsea sp.]|nr:BrnT family toxin [Ghiorsea sp.]